MNKGPRVAGEAPFFSQECTASITLVSEVIGEPCTAGMVPGSAFSETYTTSVYVQRGTTPGNQNNIILGSTSHSGVACMHPR